MKRAHKAHRNSWSVPIIVILLAMIGGGLLFVYTFESRERASEAERLASHDVFSLERLTITDGDEEYVLRDDLDTYLLIGLDKYQNTLSDPVFFVNNQQCDFLFLMIVDNTRKTYSALHLNRDTMTEIIQLGAGGKRVGTTVTQLCLAHTYGSGGMDSCRNTTQAVSTLLLGVPIDHYMSITMDGIPIINDLVGGVTVHMDDDLTMADPSFIQGKDVRLNGQQALKFVRSRDLVGNSGNLERMNRQRVYINALYAKLSDKLKSDSHFGLRLSSEISDYIVSDLITDEVAVLADKLKDYTFTSIFTISGTTGEDEETHTEFYVDEADLKQIVLYLFFTKKK